ncbi:MAG: hypothetical protein ACOCRO_09570 [Halanaerobiales bacterium]
MNKKNIIRKLGFPNKINPKKRMASKVWECANCGEMFIFDNKVKAPSPCNSCGSISFLKKEN